MHHVYLRDTTRDELTLVTLPETRVQVAGAAGAQPRRSIDRGLLVQLSIGLAGLLLVAVLARALYPYLPRIARWWVAMRTFLRALRRPALPGSLNPGSNAGE